MPGLQGIFFDLDDTLINSSVAMHAALTQILPLVPHLTVPTLAATLTDTYQELWGYGTPGYPSLRQLPTPTLRHRLTEGALHRLRFGMRP